MTHQILPTRKEEAFRYADLNSLAEVWPVVREEIEVIAGIEESRQVIELGEGVVARHLVIRLEKQAKLDLRILSAGPGYGRIAVDVELAEGADFTLGAAQLATGSETLEIVTEVTHAQPGGTSRQIVRQHSSNCPCGLGGRLPPSTRRAAI